MALCMSAAADALLGKSLLRRPPIHLIPLSARSIAMGGDDLSKRARFCVEGRSPCRGLVAASSAGHRVEALNRETAAVTQRSIHFFIKGVDHSLPGAGHAPDTTSVIDVAM